MDKSKTFIFKYDPNCSIERMFFGFKQAVEGKLKSVESNTIKSNNPEVLLNSINKNRWEIFHALVEKSPNSLTELANLLNKDYANVWRDAKILEGMGIIELKKTGQEVKPIALYNRIVFDFSVKEIPAQNSEKRLPTN